MVRIVVDGVIIMDQVEIIIMGGEIIQVMVVMDATSVAAVAAAESGNLQKVVRVVLDS